MAGFKDASGCGSRTPGTYGATDFPNDMPLRYKLKEPPKVKQLDDHACWAAALASWLRVTPTRPELSQEDILARFEESVDVVTGKDSDEVLGKGGGLDIARGFPKIAAEFYMKNDRIRDLSIEWISEKLRTGGHLYVCYNRSTYAHAIVIYAVGYSLGKGGQKTYVICYMDPWFGDYFAKPLSAFQFGTGAGWVDLSIGWRAEGSGNL